ncbi:MAG: hypothetical protein NZ899_13690 [Thermoguttaceae bacterium]|nr:hypothetical protein [Thermoguttaceae bacterium]MDW8078422.1 hypothetical protein [Thermoguttaceae bacterium]
MTRRTSVYVVLTASIGYCFFAAGMPNGLPAGAYAAPIVFENDFVRWVVDESLRTTEFVDKSSGTNYARGPVPLVTLQVGGQDYVPAAVTRNGEKISVSFAGVDAKATVELVVRPSYFLVRLVDYSGPTPDHMNLINLRLALGKERNWTSGLVSDGGFACCVRVADYRLGFGLSGGAEPNIAVTAYPRRWWEGAWAAVVAAPKEAIRTALKELVFTEEMLGSKVGGPFAQDAVPTRGSYVFADVSETNVEQWISLCQRAGIDLIHMIGWDASQGHYRPQKHAFPEGVESLRRTVEKIHAAGLRVGLHYLFGISPNDPYVTPVPDKRLKVDARFELASAVDEKTDFIPTTTVPKDLPTVWAYMSRGNVVRIGDELVQYHALSADPPGLAQCRRGVFGTKPAPHPAGTPVEHLYVIYGLFYPDEESDLIEEIAEHIAEVVNTCKVDLVYMDGAEGVPGGWYGVSRMRAEVFRRFRHPVMVEASEWGYHSWTFHSRTGAWDYPNWGLKQFVDIHVRANRAYQAGSLLPTQLGWWAILGDSPDHYAELPDELEYLCVKSLAWDMAMSFQGVTVGEPANARQEEYLRMLGQYERLRLSRKLPQKIIDQLRQEGQEFRLKQSSEGSWQFVPCRWLQQKAEFTDQSTFMWVFTNPYASQRLKLRLRVLEVAGLPSSPEAVLLTDFAQPAAPLQCAQGVEAQLTQRQLESGPVAQGAEFTARSTRPTPAGAWAQAAIRFAKGKNLSRTGAIGVWIYGDGKGQVLNFQLRNPEHHWPTCAEHYVTVDFTGWQFRELHFKERDAHRHGEFVWPYQDYYAIYRNPLIRHDVDGLTVYYNNLPPGEEVRCLIGPVMALPVQKIQVAEPEIVLGSAKLRFPVTLESGHYLELVDGEKVRHFDARGRLVAELALAGEVPVVASGRNQLELRCKRVGENVASVPEGKVRCQLWVLVEGEPLSAE